jgi:GntR family transcriptional regulator
MALAAALATARDIADGSLPPETRLPPEEDLIKRFKVSRTTVRKAIQNLIQRAIVEVRRGKGTFVTQPKITQELTNRTDRLRRGHAGFGAKADRPLARQAHLGSR